MTIKIKSLTLKKDVERTHFVDVGIVRSELNNIEGKIYAGISSGKVNGEAKVSIDTISEELQGELYTVLNKIEDELNGVKSEKGTHTIHIGELVLNASDTSGLLRAIKELPKIALIKSKINETEEGKL
ncbi:hypothetical protein [Psychrobacillus phage Perkons]|nr:hypothetical protein [Psychrobacillus phage Perkons]